MTVAHHKTMCGIFHLWSCRENFKLGIFNLGHPLCCINSIPTTPTQQTPHLIHSVTSATRQRWSLCYKETPSRCSLTTHTHTISADMRKYFFFCTAKFLLQTLQAWGSPAKSVRVVCALVGSRTPCSHTGKHSVWTKEMSELVTKHWTWWWAKIKGNVHIQPHTGSSGDKEGRTVSFLSVRALGISDLF